MLKINEYLGHGISFDMQEKRTMINATQMAEPFNKLPKDFIKSFQTQSFISALAKQENCPIIEIVNVKQGRDGGTWMHELLALKFAAWLSPPFEIWCMGKLKELLTEGTTSLRGLTLAEQLLRSAQVLVEHERKFEAIEKRIDSIEARIATRPDYFTVMGLAVVKGVKVTRSQAAIIGKKASTVCHANNWPIEKITDPRFGMVGSYPREALEPVFDAVV